MTTLPRLLTAEEVAEATGLPKMSIYKLVRQGEIPAVHVGRAVRFSESALLDWIKHGGTQPTPDEG